MYHNEMKNEKINIMIICLCIYDLTLFSIKIRRICIKLSNFEIFS
jgi:hypothetical protein